MSIEIDAIRAFVSVADNGAISRAAQTIHLSQPAVSRQVQRLEEALGTQLLDRRVRPAKLTPTGRVTLEVCRRLLKTLDELRIVNGGEATSRGECRVGVAQALAPIALADPIDYLRREFPGVRLRIGADWSRSIVEQLRARDLDLGIVYMPEGVATPADLSGKVLGFHPLVVAAPRAWKRKTITVQALADAGWVLHPDLCTIRSGLQEALEKIGAALNVVIEVNDFQTQLSLVSRNVGLTLVPEWIAERSPYRSQVHLMRVKELPLRLAVWALRSDPLPARSPALTALENRLAQVLNGVSGRPPRQLALA